MPYKTILAALLILTFSNPSLAQEITSKSGNEMAVANNKIVTIKYSEANPARATGIINPENSRLVAKFSTLFPAAQNQQWVKDNKGYWVTFNNEGRETRAGFNNSGKLNYVITNCKKEQLSEEFQNFIANNYKGYRLLNAIDINTFGEHAQQATLESASEFITLNSNQDEIGEIQKVKKIN